MEKEYDYEARNCELQNGIDGTYQMILEPFVLREVDKELYRNQNPKSNILDIGCGCGYLTMHVKQLFSEAQVKGIDKSTDAIECANRSYSATQTQYQVSDINDFISEQFYDILIFNMVLHNISDLKTVMDKSNTILKSRGTVIITVPHPVFWLADKVIRKKVILKKPFSYMEEKMYTIPFQIAQGEKHQTFLHYFHRKLESYIESFNLTGFQIVCFEEVDFKRGNPTMLRIVLRKNN